MRKLKPMNVVVLSNKCGILNSFRFFYNHMYLSIKVHAFFIRTSNFRLRLVLIFWRFQPRIVLKLFLFSDISKQCSGLVARNNKKTLTNYFILRFAKKHETVNAAYLRSRSSRTCLSLFKRPMTQLILTRLCIHVHLNLCTRIK